MLRDGQLVYGLVVVVDIEGFSRMGILAQAAILVRLEKILDRAARNAQLVRAGWIRQSRGDGELSVLPPETDVARVVADFTDQIVEELKCASRPRLRLRISMHHGTLTNGTFGPVGDTLVVACRLLDADFARETLAEKIGDDVVVVVSQRLYQDVVATRFHGLDPDRFRPFSEQVKGRTHHGYLCVGSPKSPVPAVQESSVTALERG
jgi:class 3 adenylate cyclase